MKLAVIDPDAIKIGELYRAAKRGTVEAVKQLIECGERLRAKKLSLKHGEWLTWLKDHDKILGFETRRTAARIMRLPNGTPASHLTDAEALAISREAWGHDKTNAELVLSSEQYEWYTPVKYIEAARNVLGSIDLDPASSAAANATVGASEFWTVNDGVLERQWHGRVWLNPPYCNLGGDFISHLVSQYEDHLIESAITLVNAHSTDTSWFQPLWNYRLCFTNHRIEFNSNGREKENTSTHGSVFVYLGSDNKKFKEYFSGFGPVVKRA